MRSVSARELYSPAEIARAAGVAEIDVRAALGGARQLVPHTEAVRIGRRLVRCASGRPRRAAASPLFGMFAEATPARRSAGLPLAVSTTLHASLLELAMFLAAFNLSPHAAALRPADRPVNPMRLVLLATPGPGGGGGGLLQKPPPPKALREGLRKLSSRIPERRDPKPLAPQFQNRRPSHFPCGSTP